MNYEPKAADASGLAGRFQNWPEREAGQFSRESRPLEDALGLFLTALKGPKYSIEALSIALLCYQTTFRSPQGVRREPPHRLPTTTFGLRLSVVVPIPRRSSSFTTYCCSKVYYDGPLVPHIESPSI